VALLQGRPQGIPWVELAGLLGVSDGRLRNIRPALQSDLLRAGIVIVDGVLKVAK